MVYLANEYRNVVPSLIDLIRALAIRDFIFDDAFILRSES
jgi:hypothetical protein